MSSSGTGNEETAWRSCSRSRADRPPDWTGYSRRVDRGLLSEVAPADLALTFVCGPTPFVEAVAEALVALGHEPSRIKTERFGPTGG